MRYQFILSLAAAGVPLSAANPTRRDVDSLARTPNTLNGCLNAAKAPISLSSSSDWSDQSRPFNTRVPFTPAVIVEATDQSHVVAAVKCGAQYGYKVTGRGGGHSYSSSGFGGENGHVVVQLNQMYNVKLNADNTATIQAGARLGHVATEIFNQGGRAIAHGSCPGVGVSGHSLHGGFGISSHLYGLALDWMVGAKVVVASGKIVTCSTSQNADLFWALRGAGSSFGIVIEFTFNTFEAPETVTWYTIPLTLKKVDKIVNAIYAMQTYAQNNMPPELNMQFAARAGESHFTGLYIGSEDDARSVLQSFLSPIGVSLDGATITEGDWMGQIENFGGAPLDLTGPESATDTFYASSLMTKVVGKDGFKAFVNYLQNTAKNVQRDWFVLIDVHGGANSKTAQIDASSTSYPHRDKVLLWQFYDSSDGSDYPAKGTSFVNNWMNAVSNTLPQGEWGRYANYADTQLSNTDAQNQYYMGSLTRLKTIKAKYDPKGVFTYPQGVGSV